MAAATAFGTAQTRPKVKPCITFHRDSHESPKFSWIKPVEIPTVGGMIRPKMIAHITPKGLGNLRQNKKSEAIVSTPISAVGAPLGSHRVHRYKWAGLNVSLPIAIAATSP